MTPRRTRAWLISGGLLVGAVIGGAGIASAATSGSPEPAASSSASAPSAPNGNGAGTPADPTKISHGPGETLLTGTTAEKVKSAALAAVPGATAIRVETDSAGSPYEAHLTKADGTQVTVKVDSNFTVTATENGFGGPPK
jgi:hypothetical protein